MHALLAAALAPALVLSLALDPGKLNDYRIAASRIRIDPTTTGSGGRGRARLRRDEPSSTLQGANAFGSTIPYRQLAKSQQIPTLTGIKGAQRVRLIYGPFKARGSGVGCSSRYSSDDANMYQDKAPIPNTFPSMDPDGTAYNFHLDKDFPRDITLLVAESNLLNNDYSRASLTDDKVYNHHNVFLQAVSSQQPMFRCENASIRAALPPPINLFAGAATEKFTFNFTSTEPAKINTGFYIPKDAVLQNMLDLVNTGSTREFYTETELEYLPGQPSGYSNVRHTILNPNVCGGEDGYAIHAPVGQTKFSIRSANIIMDTDGTIVRTTSHTHDGGVDLVLTINGNEACRSVVNYGGPGFSYKDSKGKTIETINSTSECRNVIRVKKGDRLKVVANFDLDKHPLRAMGSSPDVPSAGGHSHGGMRNVLDDVEASEAMALMYIYWSATSTKDDMPV